MLHSKFKDHRTLDSGEKKIFKGFYHNGHGCHIGHVTKTIQNLAKIMPQN